MMELALLLEKKVIMLKNEALKTFQIALAGTASGHLQELLEGAFGYPESRASIERGKQLEEIHQQLQANRQDMELVAIIEPTTEPANTDTDLAPNVRDITPEPGKELDKDIECPLPTKQCRRTKNTEELPDLKPLKDCPGIFPSTLFPLSQTGVTDWMYRDCIRSEGQSVYGCNLHCTDLSLCEYTSVQFSQMCTHIWHKHLAVCIQCHVCGKCSFRAVDMSAHLRMIHPDEKDKWYELDPTNLPTLAEGTTEEDLTTTIASSIKKE